MDHMQFITRPQCQSFPGAPLNTMDLSYEQFYQPQADGMQPMPSLFEQPQQQQLQSQQQYHAFPPPTGGSMDSGYAGDDSNPFEQNNSYCRDINDMNFGQARPLPDIDPRTADFASFGFMPNDEQRNCSDLSFMPISFSAPFQQNYDLTSQRIKLSQSPPALAMDDAASIKSEDASTESASPRQILPQNSGHVKPQKPLQRPKTLKRTASDSSTEARPTSPERPTAKEGRGRQRKRIPHTAVERRYRENLNLHLEKLRSAVPGLQAAHRRRSSDGIDPMKPSKCEVLIGAVEYIKRLETENAKLKRVAE